MDNPAAVAVDSSDNVNYATGPAPSANSGPEAVPSPQSRTQASPGFSGDGGRSTTARLGKIGGIALDASGNIYIVDGENNRIRRVDVSTGIITTIAGNGAATDSGDGALAVNAGVARPTGITVDQHGDLYFSNWSRARQITARTGMIETTAGGFSPVSAATMVRR